MYTSTANFPQLILRLLRVFLSFYCLPYCHPACLVRSRISKNRGKSRSLNKPLTFLKWWSSLASNVTKLPAITKSSANPFHSSHTLFPNLYFPTSSLTLLLNNFKLCPRVVPSTTSKNLSGSNLSNPLKILYTSIKSALRNHVSRVIKFKILNLWKYPRPSSPSSSL